MFDSIRRARTDLAVMDAVLPAAERLAHADGIPQPGAEHLLLGALELPDGWSYDVIDIDEPCARCCGLRLRSASGRAHPGPRGSAARGRRAR